MTLRRFRSENGSVSVRLIECPVCGEPLSNGRSTERRDHMLLDHYPEDFGLSPLGGSA